MEKNNTLLAGVIGAAAIIIIIVLVTRGPSSTPTTVVVNPPSTTTTPTQSTRQPGAPIAITNSDASPTDTTVIVKGSVTPNGVFTNYWYEYGTTTNLGTKTSNQSVGSGYTVTSAPGYITGLVKDTTYYYHIVAENQFGRVMGTAYSFQTTHGNPPPVGGAPGTKTTAASSITRTGVVLDGEVTPNRSQTIYWFEYGKSADLGNTTAFVSAGDGTAKVSVAIPISGLDPGTTYYFRLDAQNQFGTVQGTILNFKTSGPVTTLPGSSTGNATAVGTTTATVRGTIDPNGDSTMYWFEYGTDSVLGNVLVNSTDRKSAGDGTAGITVQADLTRLTSKTTYYYQLVAQNSLGLVRGNRLSFTTD